MSVNSVFVILVVGAAIIAIAGGIAAIVLGIERLRNRGGGSPQDPLSSFFYIAIIVLVISGLFVFFYGR